MDIEQFRNFCLALPYTTESFPFDSNVLAFKVKEKLFALTNIEAFETINLKCDPEQAILLREKYSDVVPGYHMNKKHWNTIRINASVKDKDVLKWVIDSYKLVVNSLPKKEQFDISKI